MKKILVVDDIEEYVESIAVCLEDRFEIVKALSFEETKKRIDAGGFDLALIDIRLSEDDPSNKEGLEILKLIKKVCPCVGVIMMSAYKEFDFAVEALNSGADYFLHKPLDPKKLNSIIDDLNERCSSTSS